ncbi:MAG: hypothetical protein HKO66_03505, partial [Saprospiraceae bacterium]|nr:hypothetical protein [Saprospiraceae bacterium]
MNSLQLTIVVVTLMLCQSCRPIYVPNIHNVPLLKEKTDVSVTLSLNDLQGAYAVSDNIGIMASLYRNNVNFAYDFDENVNRKYFEIGAGYFTRFGKFGVFELYGGYGIGDFEFGKSQGANDYYSANTSRIFIQPNVAFSYKIIDVVFSTRVFSYSIHDPDLTRYGGPDTFDTDLSDVHLRNYQYIEPASTPKLGWKQAKVFWQTIV